MWGKILHGGNCCYTPELVKSIAGYYICIKYNKLFIFIFNCNILQYIIKNK